MMIAELKRRKTIWLGTLCIFVALLFTGCGSKSSKVLEKIKTGQNYLAEENYTEAVQAFTEAIETGPNNILAYMGRAEAYTKLMQYEEAKADYESVIAKGEKQPLMQAEAYVNEGKICEQMGDESGAQSSYNSALALLDRSEMPTSETKDELMAQVENALERLGANSQQNGPQDISPLPLASVQSPLPDGTYDASLDCGNAVSGNNLSFQVFDCYYYDAAQVESLQPGDTISGQYDYFYDDAKFTMQIENVSSLEGIESRWIGGMMQDEYSSEPYEKELYLIREGPGYFITMDDSSDRTWYEKKDFRPIGDAVEKMSDDIVLKATPLEKAQTTVSGIENVKKVIAANDDSWWMVGSLSITVKNHQITEISYLEHSDEEDEGAGESNFKMPSAVEKSAVSTAEKVDLADYIGTDLHDFLATRPELKSDGATSGEEYTDGKLVVGASYNGTKIDFVDLRQKCGYSIAGIECGMAESEAIESAEQKYGKPSSETGNYKYYTIDDAMSTELGIRIQNGKVEEVSIMSELNLYE